MSVLKRKKSQINYTHLQPTRRQLNDFKSSNAYKEKISYSIRHLIVENELEKVN